MECATRSIKLYDIIPIGWPVSHLIDMFAASSRSLVERREREVAALEERRNELEAQVAHTENDSSRLRDALRAEQQALHALQSEKKDILKQTKRAADDAKR